MGTVKINLNGTIEYNGNVYVRRKKCLAEPDADMSEPPVVRWWLCNGCGRHFVVERGDTPSYCPKCGGMVM